MHLTDYQRESLYRVSEIPYNLEKTAKKRVAVGKSAGKTGKSTMDRGTGITGIGGIMDNSCKEGQVAVIAEVAGKFLVMNMVLARAGPG